MNSWLLRCCALTVVVLAFVAVPAIAQMTSVGIDCAQIQSSNLLKQENMRAGKALIECGVVQGGRPEGDSDNGPLAPPNILVSNRTCTSGASCTKSENMVWSQGSTIIVNYNDHNPAESNTYGGISYSKDGGATFTEILPDPLATGHGQNYGDPIVVYNVKLGKWFAGDLVAGCGGQGIGLWTSTDGINWTVGACAHSGSQDDRESMWVDNNPFSTGYGRMYISYNNFNIGGGALFVMYSNDGVTWTNKQLTSSFIRDVQITGVPPVPTSNNITPNVPYSYVYVAAMDEGGGGASTRQNVMYRSTDGGNSWSSYIMGPRFNPVGDASCGYFYQVNPIWRHMGWGQPAAGPNGVVHYVFAGAGTGSDHGDIFYTRSADKGVTWSTPIKLNTDADGQYKTQWMPSLSVTSSGKVTASWYDRRLATSVCTAVGQPGCNYERYARQSPDNGLTWGADFAISTSIINQPAQADPGVVSCYAGDYDYNTAVNNNAWVTWTDGRRNVGGTQVQDVDFAAVPQ